MKRIRLQLKCLIIGMMTMALLAGCARTTTRKATVETPDKTYEIKVEKTEK